jgi:hypothetical protein
MPSLAATVERIEDKAGAARAKRLAKLVSRRLHWRHELTAAERSATVADGQVADLLVPGVPDP